MAKKKTEKSPGKSGAAPSVRQKSKSKARSNTGKRSAIRSGKRTTDRDRLVTLASLTRGRGKDKLYTMQEIADSLGISTRTLRRVKNQKGYNVAPRTYQRIHSDLVANYRKISPQIRKHYNIPKTSAIPKPREFRSKSGKSRTLAFPSEGMTADEKLRFANQLHDSSRFTYWRMRVRVPHGVSLSGRVDSERKEVEYNRSDEPVYYMAGPFDFREGRDNEANIRAQIKFHEDAGREVVEIFVDEML